MQKEYIVVGRNNQLSKTGSQYANLRISAQKGEVFTVTVWDLGENEGPMVEDIVKVDMDVVKTVRFPKKADLRWPLRFRKATPQDSLYSLIPRPIDKSDWDNCLDHLIDYCSDDRLIDFIQSERNELFTQYSTKTAATAMHHAFKGGLLNHTYELLRMLEGLYPTLPPIHIERCIIAVMFHDYGKMREYDDNLEPTKYMYLMGHTYISAHVLHNKLNAAGISNEETIRIIHCVLAHHGELEYGSPVVPCTQEAVVVHYIDNLSAHTNACDETPNMEKCFALGTKVVKD